ncbi:MAG: ABC transporter substrate-binding protein [Candidatus Caldarchaeum sp.]
MVNYKAGMIASLLVAVMLAGALASYGIVGPTSREVTVTVARTATEFRTEIRTETKLVTVSPTETLKKVTVGTLGPPSQSSWIVFIVEELGLDKKYGLDIEWVLQPSTTALYQDFAAGKYKVSTGGMMTFANMYLRGVPIKIFITYTLFGTAIIVNKERGPDVNSVKDLEGKIVAGPLTAENLRAMQMYMRWLGADLSKIQFQNFEHLAVPTELTSPTGRAVAGIAWETIPSRLELQDPAKFKVLYSIPELDAVWQKNTGTQYHWLLGFAAYEEVIKADPDVLQKIYLIFREATNYIRDFPDEAMKIIVKNTNISEELLKDAFNKGRLRFLVKPIHTEMNAVKQLFKVANDLGFINGIPDDNIFYKDLKIIM